MREADPRIWIGPFIGELQRLLGSNRVPRDAGTLAKLRRGLTENPADRDMWVYAHLGGASPQDEEHALLIASLFALWHQGGREHLRQPSYSFGGSYGRLRSDNGSETVEKRFAALIDSHLEDLSDRLRSAVSLLRSKEIGINWQSLLIDLLQWDNDTRIVQRRWARDFWAAARGAATD
jgi:CRISPR system Cascade subunit CasB